MKLMWSALGASTVVNIGSRLCNYYSFEHKAVTIIWNCLIPIMAIFLVIMLNELERLVGVITASNDDDETL